MVTTTNFDPRPIHPLKRSQKTRLRKELEKQAKEKARQIKERF